MENSITKKVRSYGCCRRENPIFLLDAINFEKTFVSCTDTIFDSSKKVYDTHVEEEFDIKR